MRALERTVPKEQFYQRLNAMKRPGHGRILVGNRQGWYGFRENIMRGYEHGAPAVCTNSSYL